MCKVQIRERRLEYDWQDDGLQARATTQPMVDHVDSGGNDVHAHDDHTLEIGPEERGMLAKVFVYDDWNMFQE